MFDFKRKYFSCINAGCWDSISLKGGTWGSRRIPIQGLRGYSGFLVLSCFFSSISHAGALVPADPIVESNRYVIPVVLQESGNGVTALDFQLDFDPALFTPVRVEAGPAATAAGKILEANLSQPGGYKVVVMGLNQSPIPDGEVARVVLERTADLQDATRFSVNQPTLALADGSKQSAQGGGIDVVPEAETPTEDDSPDSENDDDPETPSPDEGEPAEPETDDVLDEEETEELVDMVLGALDVGDEPERASVTAPLGASPVSDEALGRDKTPRGERRHPTIGRGNTLTVIGKERILSSDDQSAEASLEPVERSVEPVQRDTTEEIHRTPVRPADEPERVARVIGTVESVGDVAGAVPEQRSSRVDGTDSGWNRPLAVAVTLLVASALLGGAAWQLRKRAR